MYSQSTYPVQCSPSSFSSAEAGEFQYYQYTPYQMQTQYMAQPSWAFSLDDYTDDSDSDSDSQTPVPAVNAATTNNLIKDTSVPCNNNACSLDDYTDASDSDSEAAPTGKDALSDAPNSPRSQDQSTCDPESDGSSIASDTEDIMQRSASLPSHGDVPCFSIASMMKMRHSVAWLEGIEDRQLKAVDHETGYKMQPECASKKAPASPTKRSRRSGKKTKKTVAEEVATGADKVQMSEESWMAQQMERRNSSQGVTETIISDSDVMRSVKSILNKLTIEKFATLFQKLVTCGIRKRSHVNALMVEVYEKAAMQHHFITMYADMCIRLCSHFHEQPIADEPDMNFEQVLLSSRDAFNEAYLTLPSDFDMLDEEDRLAIQRTHKLRKLGAMKFLGALLVRQLLNANIFFETCKALLGDASAENLEMLAALLTMVGPKWDTPQCFAHAKLTGIFEEIKSLISQPKLNRRACFLLKDLLEFRAAGWVDQKPKIAEAPTTLKAVAETQAAEQAAASQPQSRKEDKSMSRLSRLQNICQRKTTFERAAPKVSENKDSRITRLQNLCRPESKHTESAAPPAADVCYSGRHCSWPGCKYAHPKGRIIDEQLRTPPPPPPPPREEVATPSSSRKSSDSEGSSIIEQVGKVKRRYRKNACRKEISEALSDLSSSQDMKKALVRIASLAVPVSKQSEEFAFMLTTMIKESSALSRKLFFEMVVCLFTEGIWIQQALTSGLESVLDAGCSDLEKEVPELSKILWQELHPAVAPLVSKAISQ